MQPVSAHVHTEDSAVLVHDIDSSSPTQGICTQLCISCDPAQPPCKGWGTGILNQMRADQELLDLEIYAKDQLGAWVSVRVHTLIMVHARASPHTWRMDVHADPDEH